MVKFIIQISLENRIEEIFEKHYILDNKQKIDLIMKEINKTVQECLPKEQVFAGYNEGFDGVCNFNSCLKLIKINLKKKGIEI